ncbi:response regulator [Methylogaea oryzae]|uniref:Response regulator n=1 Tax=Methylogaea oryzae TaxID=1295382 RepID=A0A8D5AKV5_9GAMM|nr:response regulator [Methylogaea oryzae]BBL71521.1 response regulator [Methylogaea oryzae]
MAAVNVADLSILLVEPSATQLKLIQRSLADAGVNHVEGLSSGQEALDVMERFPPDLVVSAMYLPDMTATELVHAMRQHDTLQAVPFMLISSETHFNALDPIRQAGVVAILPKPFGQEELRRALRSTMEFIDPQELELSQVDLDDLRVLVVDDSSTARGHIKRVLSNLGMSRISTAQNGREAADMFANSSFDLIVTDLNMPEMDGLQLVQYVRQRLGDAAVPILMVTSEQDATRLASVEQSGVSAICDKPFEPQNIKEILARVLQQ